MVQLARLKNLKEDTSFVHAFIIPYKNASYKLLDSTETKFKLRVRLVSAEIKIKRQTLPS